MKWIESATLSPQVDDIGSMQVGVYHRGNGSGETSNIDRGS
jgi:hypothetical protein